MLIMTVICLCLGSWRIGRYDSTKEFERKLKEYKQDADISSFKADYYKDVHHALEIKVGVLQKHASDLENETSGQQAQIQKLQNIIYELSKKSLND